MRTLQRLCLHVICSNLDSSLKELDPYEKSYLQRYHFDVISVAIDFEMLKNKAISFDWMDFTINPYVKNLNINCKYYNCEQVLERLRVCGETISRLKFVGGLRWSARRLIKCLSLTPNIQSIELSKGRVAVNLLKSIPKYCPNLKVLRLTNMALSDQKLEFLCPEQQGERLNRVLKVLDLDGVTGITETGIQFVLDHFPEIETLNHEKLLVNLSNVWAFRQLNQGSAQLPLERYNIKSIKLGENYTYGIRFLFDLCPFVESLTFVERNSHIRESVRDLRELKCLKINWTEKVGYPDICPVLLWNASQFFTISCHCLVELYLRSVSMDSLALDGLKSCRHLQKLTLIQVKIVELGQVDDSVDSCLSSLQYLELREMNFRCRCNKEMFKFLVRHSCYLHTFIFHLNSWFPKDLVNVLSQNKFLTGVKRVALNLNNLSASTLHNVIDIIGTATQLEVVRFVTCNFHASVRKELVDYCKAKWCAQVGFIIPYCNDPFNTVCSPQPF